MTEAERLADALDGWSGFIGSGYECPAAGQPMLEAAALLRSQAEELERLRRALRETQKPKLITPVAVLNDDGSQSFSSQALGEM